MDKERKSETDGEASDSRTSMFDDSSNMGRSGIARLFSGWSTKEFVAELLGTFILMVINNSVIAVFTIKRPVTEDTLAMGYVGVSGGHVNPSVTVAFAICNRMKRNKVFHYLTAQYLGSFLAQCMVWVLYHQHIDDYDGGVRSAYGEANSTGKIFTTFPPPTATLTTCIIDQIFGGFLLLIGVCAIIDQRGMKIPIYLQPFIISVFIAGYGTSLGYNAGGINPARDLAPRIFTVLVGYGWQAFHPFGGHYWYAVGVLAPHLGAILGVLTFDFLIGTHLNGDDPTGMEEPLLKDMPIQAAENPDYILTYTRNCGAIRKPSMANFRINGISNSFNMEDLTIHQKKQGYNSTSPVSRSRSKSINHLSKC